MRNQRFQSWRVKIAEIAKFIFKNFKFHQFSKNDKNRQIFVDFGSTRRLPVGEREADDAGGGGSGRSGERLGVLGGGGQRGRQLVLVRLEGYLERSDGGCDKKTGALRPEKGIW